jgi:uncharacterized protein YciU (UPF0263 family)
MPFLSVLEQQDKVGIAVHLSQFKERGVINFGMALSVPTEERIPMLAKSPEGYNRLLIALSASLKSAMANINLRVGLSEDQLVELADQIITESSEDNLSLEDVLLFLQLLVTGKAGKIYDRLDIPTFFELFETYREDRHQALLNVRYEQSVNHRALGPTDRTSEETDKDAHREALADHLKNLYKDK